MFKKWYNGVNNYVLELEQLQTRGAVQNWSKKWLPRRLGYTPGVTDSSRSKPDLPEPTAVTPLVRPQGVAPIGFDKSRITLCSHAHILFALVICPGRVPP
jgi:hypothetical protein